MHIPCPIKNGTDTRGILTVELSEDGGMIASLLADEHSQASV